MPESFDPYHLWLGIRAEEQPADCYRLLGISTYEDDPAVIEAAADRQMGHLRTYQAGEHASHSQKLLNEVSAARIQLLDPKKKALYDQTLRQRSVARKPAEPVVVAVGGRRSTSKLARRRKTSPWPIAVGLGGVAVVGVMVAAYLSSSPPSQAPSTDRPTRRIVQLAPATTEVNEPHAPAEPEPPPPITSEEPADEPPQPDEPSTEDVAPAEEPPVEEPPEPNRLPVPTDMVQQSIGGDLEDIYKLAQIESPQEQLKMARTLLSLVAKTENADERFVILRRTTALAGRGGDAALMLRAADAIAEQFDIDGLSAKAKLLTTFEREAQTTERIKSLVEAGGPIIDEALEAEQYDIALRLATDAYRAAECRAGREYRKATYDRRNEVRRLHADWQAVVEAVADLESNPDDADAHLVLGRWHCFTKADWQQGLSHLSIGADASLKTAAQRELATPATPATQVALADTWWEFASDEDPSVEVACRRHAADWYRRALPDLDGLEQTRVEKRVKEVEDAIMLSKSPEQRQQQWFEALRKAKPVNLGAVVNSGSSDANPALSVDGCVLLFASDRSGGVGAYDLWMCVRPSQDAAFGPPTNLGPTVNSQNKEGGPALSADGRMLLFHSERPGGRGESDLWMCGRNTADGSFGAPINLGSIINSKDREYYPKLSADGLTLLFSSNRPGGLGWQDLWMCQRASPKQPFGAPVHLGPTINSKAVENCPFVSADGRIFLFRSYRSGGLGRGDIWMCARTSLREDFGDPVNLGPSVNSSYSDGSPMLSRDGRLLLFESDRPGGHGDMDLWMLQLDFPDAE